MRVLQLPSSYFPDTLGVTDFYVEQLDSALRARGHESMVAWHTGSVALPAEAQALPALGPASRRALQTRDNGRDPPGFEALLERVRPDLLHFHALTLGAGVDHARVAKRFGIPYLVTFHTPAMACPRGTWMRHGSEPCDGQLIVERCAGCVLEAIGWPRMLSRIGARSPLEAERLADGPWQTHLALPSLLEQSFASWRRFFGGAQHVVACASFVADRLIANGVPPERVSVIRQALPGATRRRTLREPPRDGPIRLGFVGRFTHVKGPDLLLRAADELFSRGVRCSVELVGPVGAGEEPWRDSLLARCRVPAQHLGELRGEVLQRWVEAIDVMVVPSRWFETGPLTLLEAWDAGTPVLGTDLGGIREFMDAQGLRDCLVPLESARGIAAGIERLLARREPLPTIEVPGMDVLVEAMIEIYGRCCAAMGQVPREAGWPRGEREATQ